MVKPLFTIDTGRLKADLSKIGDRLDFARQLALNATAEAMTMHGHDMIADAQKRLEPQTRSGNLGASGGITEPEFSSGVVTLDLGSNIEYARQVDQGGTITAKRGRMLAIPLDPALTASGVPRFSSPREIPGAFVLKLWGKVFIAAEAGKGKNRVLTLFYILKHSVTQKGSHFFSRTVYEKGPQVGRAIADNVGRALGGGR